MSETPANPPVLRSPGDSAVLERLNVELRRTEVEVEFYFLGGAVMFQAFNANPKTAHVSAMFRPAGPVKALIDQVGAEAQAGPDWLPRVARDLLGDGPSRRDYLSFSNLSLFRPLPAYVFAVKCAAMRLADDFTEEDDVRYVLRAMNIGNADAAMAVVAPYFSERQLVPTTRMTLERLLGG